MPETLTQTTLDTYETELRRIVGMTWYRPQSGWPALPDAWCGKRWRVLAGVRNVQWTMASAQIRHDEIRGSGWYGGVLQTLTEPMELIDALRYLPLVPLHTGALLEPQVSIFAPGGNHYLTDCAKLGIEHYYIRDAGIGWVELLRNPYDTTHEAEVVGRMRK